MLGDVRLIVHWQVHAHAPGGATSRTPAAASPCCFINGLCCQQCQQGTILLELMPPEAKHINSCSQWLANKLTGLKAVQRLCSSCSNNGWYKSDAKPAVEALSAVEQRAALLNTGSAAAASGLMTCRAAAVSASVQTACMLYYSCCMA
jgi:hypothetical protein